MDKIIIIIQTVYTLKVQGQGQLHVFAPTVIHTWCVVIYIKVYIYINKKFKILNIIVQKNWIAQDSNRSWTVLNIKCVIKYVLHIWN